MRMRNGYVRAFLLVILATAVALPLRDRIVQSELVMVYFLAVVLAAARGRGPAFFASVASVALFDFLFVLPYGTLRVNDLRHVLTFAMMLVVGLVIGTLTARLRETAAAALRLRTEEMRNTLLSSVSHDLRTPLATIKGSATALLSADALPEHERNELLVLVQEEADRLERLVSNLLQMTRLESGGLRVRKQWVPLDEIVGSALRRFDGTLARRVRVEVPEDAIVPLDDVLMENVLVNLLDNAFRHTTGETPIEIRAEAGPGSAVIEIADRGAGFPAGAEEKLFEKFWQSGTTRKGAGLGLPICRGILAAHGGTIRALRREGGGSIFRLTLPLDGGAPPVPGETREAA